MMSTRSAYLRRPKSAVHSRNAKAGSRTRPATAGSRRYKSSKNAKLQNQEPVCLEDVKPVPKFIDTAWLIENVLSESSIEITEHMQPQNLFGKFLQKNMFDKTTIRDMQELQTTLERNNAIKDLLVEHLDKYRLFKICLAETGQFPLVESLQIREIKLHDQLKDLGYLCTCTNTDTCSNLMSIRCSPAKYMRIALTQPTQENALLQLQSNLINIYQYFCLCEPICPLPQGKTCPMHTLYVPPSLSTVHGKPSNKPLHDMNNSNNNSKIKFMESYEEIFYQDGKPCRNIYIAAESGMGKSALCEILVRKWCEAHVAKQAGSNANLDVDHKTMSEFPLLFYIPLSAATEEVDIEEMIKKQHLTNFDVSQFLEKEKCLVILDGLDEWKQREPCNKLTSDQIPSRKSNMDKTVVLTTSRYWKLQTCNWNENEIDHLITIYPLGKTSCENLSENMIDVIEKNPAKTGGATNKLAGSFLKDITKGKKVHLLDTPVLQIQLLRLWCEEIPFGTSKCETYSTIINDQLKHDKSTVDTVREVSTDMISKSVDLPDCLTKNDQCLENQRLLCSLSKLAFTNLLQTHRENALVFDFAEAMSHGIYKDDVRMCLNIGILKQNAYYGTQKDDLKVLKFIHKSHHEFLAAVFLASHFNIQGMKQIDAVVNSFEMVMEFEEMIVFGCGMDHRLVYELTKHICKQLSNIDEVQIYKNSCTEPKHQKAYEYVLKILSLVAKCIVEAHSNEFTDICVFVSDIIVCKETLKDVQVYLSSIDSESIELVSITTDQGSNEDEQTYGKAVELASKAKSLRKFQLDDSGVVINVENIYITVESTWSTLTALVLSNIHLVSLGDKLETMLTYPHLKSLGLISVSLSNEQLQFLTLYLAEKSQLCELQLVELLGSSGKAYCYKLDLAEQKRLEKLYLRDLYVEEIIMDASKLLVCEISYLHITGVMKSVLNYLKEETKLREFICYGCSQSTDVNALADSLRHFISLRSVTLQHIDFDRFVPRVTSGAEHLRNVSLTNVTITEAALLRLFGSFPAEAITVSLDHVSVVEVDTENEETICELLSKKFPQLSVIWNLCRAKDKNSRWQPLALNPYPAK